MKDITRIHIAKIAYDIELSAKKELEKYMSALEHYAEDKETLDDIEIRITELLAERNVTAGGVIAGDDIAAVRERLGEPSAFAPDDADGAVVEAEQAIQDGKRVYRDIDNAIVGGVLAGIARYFGIDSLWVRLIFIVLLVPSFGTFVLIYAILWMIVPPAKTAAQKLQSRGEPVTLESIKKLSENQKINESARTARTVLRYISGVAMVISGLGTLIVTGFISVGIFGIGYEGSHFVDSGDLKTWWFVAAIILFTIAGTLLSALQLLLANVTLRKVWNKSTTIAVIAIIAAGLMAFAAGIGSIWYGSWQESARIRDAYHTSTADLDESFSKIKSLTVTADDDTNTISNIEYIVSDKPRYEISALPGIKPKFDISEDGKSVTLKLTRTIINSKNSYGYYANQPSLKVYGPALDNISAKSGTVNYLNESTQQNINIESKNGSVSLTGTYKNTNVDAKDSATINLEEATIENLNIKMASSEINAGVVRTLTVSQPEACPAGDDSGQNTLKISGVSTDKFTYNGVERSVMAIKNNCGRVMIGDHEIWED